MSRILYYLIIKPFSWLPFGVLYALSDVFYIILYKLIGYRKGVVGENLRHAFPNKTEKERGDIESKFYRHLCDVIVESIKVFSITQAQAKERFRFTNPEILSPYFKAEKNLIFIAGHYNNWELGGVMGDVLSGYQSTVIINELNDPFLNRKFQLSRGRFGVTLLPTGDIIKYIGQEHPKPYALIFLSDQSPTHSKRPLYIEFLNQKTPVSPGAEFFARRYNYPVLFSTVKKIKRGHYEATFHLLEDEPRQTSSGEITEKHVRLLEQQILEEPAYWLWSHRRWKLTR